MPVVLGISGRAAQATGRLDDAPLDVPPLVVRLQRRLALFSQVLGVFPPVVDDQRGAAPVGGQPVALQKACLVAGAAVGERLDERARFAFPFGGVGDVFVVEVG